MARKKVVLVIVEGASDSTALEFLFDKVFDKDLVHVRIMHCDITTENGASPSNILSRIGNIVKAEGDRNHFTRKHLKEVIHIVDMDGAYVDDVYIEEDPELESVVYSENWIKTNKRDSIIKRNEQKRGVLNKICETATVYNGVPYSVYYMSCNLDHVLFDKMNCTDEEKENKSYAFAKEYKENIDECVNFFSNSKFSVRESYGNSWKYIKEGKHSLERHTNVGICLTKS